MAALSEGRHGARDGRIDMARGIAVIAMVVYHITWDLAAFGFIDPATATMPGFRRLGATIAGSFLLLSGIALVFARHVSVDDAVFRAKFLRRLAIIAGAAVLVSIGTWFAMGDRFVRFGILHCIGLSGVIALPFLRRPAWLAAIAGVVILALPWLITGPAFSHPALLWLGLSPTPPPMVDFVPVLPFAGMALLGVALGPMLLGTSAQTPPPESTDSWLQTLGRWSLPIYLIHQPVLYGGLFLLAALTATATRSVDPASPDRDTVAFRLECRKACEAQGNGRDHCDRYCTCAEADMKSTGIWTRVMASPDSTRIQPDLAPLLQACFAKAATPQ